MLSGDKSIEFRLYSEGSNKRPRWGIAFRHHRDISRLLDADPHERPTNMEIQFPDGAIYIFGICDSFWTSCHEFVDSQAIGEVRPVESWAIHRLGYDVTTKRKCRIIGIVVERNRRLKLVNFQ